MNRFFMFAGALALGVILSGAAVSADDKEITIKDIMTKAHKGGNSVLRKADKAAKSKDFEDLSKEAKTLVKLGEDLSKAKPEKGEDSSWKKLTSAYVKNAKALESAAKDKDLDGVTNSLKALTTSCKRCHDTHK